MTNDHGHSDHEQTNQVTPSSSISAKPRRPCYSRRVISILILVPLFAICFWKYSYVNIKEYANASTASNEMFHQTKQSGTVKVYNNNTTTTGITSQSSNVDKVINTNKQITSNKTSWNAEGATKESRDQEASRPTSIDSSLESNQIFQKTPPPLSSSSTSNSTESLPPSSIISTTSLLQQQFKQTTTTDNGPKSSSSEQSQQYHHNSEQTSTTQEVPQKPNILLIMTDQQTATMMSCAIDAVSALSSDNKNGTSTSHRKYLHTPAMDYLATNGIRFTKAYTTNSVCSAARVGLMTGRLPGNTFKSGAGGNQLPVRHNAQARTIRNIPKEIKPQYLSLGSMFYTPRNNRHSSSAATASNTNEYIFNSQSDYDLVYGGKTHLPTPLLPQKNGFKTILTENDREELATIAAKYIQEKQQQYSESSTTSSSKRKNDSQSQKNIPSTPPRPYFMWLNFINPHDICFYAMNKFPTKVRDIFGNKRHSSKELQNAVSSLQKQIEENSNKTGDESLSDYLPPLPVNFKPQFQEPKAIDALLDISSQIPTDSGKIPFRRYARSNATELDWRHHRYVYYYLIEIVDKQIQVVLDALKGGNNNDDGDSNNFYDESNTIVIFTSDHGDHSGAHQLEHKSTLYEEAINVPLIVMHNKKGDGDAVGGLGKGIVDDTHLISNGLDLPHTIWDYAGLPKPKTDPKDPYSFVGKSIRPLLEELTLSASIKKNDDNGNRIEASKETRREELPSSSSLSTWRTTLGVESHIGRVVISEDGYKYVRYDMEGTNVVEEQLLDLNLDPYETTHYTSSNDEVHQRKLDELRRMFDEEWFPT